MAEYRIFLEGSRYDGPTTVTVTTREDAERIVTKQAPQDVRRVEELDTDGQVIREFGVGDGIEWDRIVWSQCDRLAR